MQYIQFQPQLSSDITTPDVGNVNLFADTITGTLLVKDSNGYIMSGSVGIASASAGTTSPMWGNTTLLDVGKRYQAIDTSNQIEALGWYLPTGSYDGQTVTFVNIYNGGGSAAPTDVKIYMDSLRGGDGSQGTQLPWYPFAIIGNNSAWRNLATTTWIVSSWVIDNDNFD